MRASARARARFLAFAAGSVVVLAAACQRDASSPAAPTLASGSSLPHINNNNLALPAAITGALTAEECSNNPGPRITLEGVTALGGVGVAMRFTNNMKGTHEAGAESNISVAMLPAGEAVSIPKQPVLGGTGGNPFMWIQFTDAAGRATSEEVYIGRCVQGERYGFTRATSTTAAAEARFAVQSCENSPGPYITLDGGMVVGGLGARIIFRNNDNPVGGPHEGDVVREVTILGAGTGFTFPKQPVQGGVGGNPWIFAGFTDGASTAIGSQTLIGRCEQLSKALAG